MSDPVFLSGLGTDMEAFIIQKRVAGYPYISSTRTLKQLDGMITEIFPESSILTKEICDTWIEECSKPHQNTLLRKVTPVRQFGKYLAGTGKPAYIIPGGIPRKQIRYDAHIFTETELKAFFTSIDQCGKSPFSPYRCYVIPVIFRLLFTCGLRSSEARLLSIEDVDLASGKIYIRSSKGWEARIVYVSGDMLDLLCRYDLMIRKLEHPNNTIEVFINSLRPGDTIYIHPEAEYHPSTTLQKIINARLIPGIAINPGTSVESIRMLLRIVKKVLVMSVNPGNAAQMFLPYVGEKYDKLLAIKDRMGFEVYWDGACGADKIQEFAPKGVKGFVLGTTLLFGKGKPYGEILKEIREMAMK